LFQFIKGVKIVFNESQDFKSLLIAWYYIESKSQEYLNKQPGHRSYQINFLLYYIRIKILSCKEKHSLGIGGCSLMKLLKVPFRNNSDY